MRIEDRIKELESQRNQFNEVIGARIEELKNVQKYQLNTFKPEEVEREIIHAVRQEKKQNKNISKPNKWTPGILDFIRTNLDKKNQELSRLISEKFKIKTNAAQIAFQKSWHKLGSQKTNNSDKKPTEKKSHKRHKCEKCHEKDWSAWSKGKQLCQQCFDKETLSEREFQNKYKPMDDGEIDDALEEMGAEDLG